MESEALPPGGKLHVDPRRIIALWAGLCPGQEHVFLHLLHCEECRLAGPRLLSAVALQGDPVSATASSSWADLREVHTPLPTAGNGGQEAETGAAVPEAPGARGWCARAEAHRRRGALGESSLALAKADCALEGRALDHSERALYCRVLARLRQDQEQVDEALALIDRSVNLFAQHLDFEELAETLADRGWILLGESEAASALASLLAALALVTRSNPRLALRVRYGLALCLAELGRGAEADDLLRSSRALSLQVPAGRPRLAWVEAQVQERAGTAARARDLFASAVSGFLTEGAIFDAALAALDLARLDLECERFDRLIQRSAEMSSIARLLPAAAAEVFDHALQAASAGMPKAPAQIRSATRMITHLRNETELSHGEITPD